ncbi:RusA family crossover junction endodeoxyribonuclease [Moraxella nasovis]|uniref:RusA family crossover junction endodeoxyribonuclease n=1 Tax=Moraxella nasovis TaxID=2904121 RepID=UPI001F61FB53|nr:RusA family crossover junction endodeoxyribonuclease [Moraxella nasovis]UNU74133.1 RusA family crossover junction endodeoxyribonuclease [Moraxella nasovis]
MKHLASLVLPMPPTVNQYWRSASNGFAKGVKVYLSKQAQAYKHEVYQIVKKAGLDIRTDKRLKMYVMLNFKDKRKNDLDNRMKGLLDALTHAGVYQDDSQIDKLIVERGIEKTNAVTVNIWELP